MLILLFFVIFLEQRWWFLVQHWFLVHNLSNTVFEIFSAQEAVLLKDLLYLLKITEQNISICHRAPPHRITCYSCLTALRRLKHNTHISLKKLAEANKVQAGGCIFKNTYKVKVKIFRPQKSSMTCPIKSINVVCTYSHYFFIMYLVHVL